MSEVRRYLALIGRRGGLRSRRALDPETAREMVRVREARRAERLRAPASPHLQRVAEFPADTTTAAGTAQDIVLRRLSAARKLARVAALSRTVDALSRAGVKLRHPGAGDRELHYRYAVLRLGPELAGRAYGAQ